MRRASRATAALGAALVGAVLAGCATTAPVGVPYAKAPSQLAARWHRHKAALDAISQFTLNGRVAAKGSFGLSGSLYWRQNGHHFRARFSGPFGAGAVDIAGDAYVVQIRSGKKRYVTSDPQSFLLKQFGWTLPLQGLRYWALGLPAPEAVGAAPAKLMLNPDGTLRSVSQSGWILDYLAYQSAGPNAAYRLPKTLVMHGSNTEFRVIIDRWGKLPPKHQASAN